MPTHVLQAPTEVGDVDALSSVPLLTPSVFLARVPTASVSPSAFFIVTALNTEASNVAPRPAVALRTPEVVVSAGPKIARIPKAESSSPGVVDIDKSAIGGSRATVIDQACDGQVPWEMCDSRESDADDVAYFHALSSQRVPIEDIVAHLQGLRVGYSAAPGVLVTFAMFGLV